MIISKIKILIIFCLGALGFSSLAFAFEDNDKLITIDDVMALKSVGSPRISPKGDWIAYTVRTTDMDKDKRTTRIWMVSSDGKTTLPLTAKSYSAGSPRWSPDGKSLAFLSSKGIKDGKSQVWQLDMRGGEATQYTHSKNGVNSFIWAPNGKAMALIIKDQNDDQKAKEADKNFKAKPKPWVIDRLQFKQDYVGYLDRTRNHIYIVEEGDEEPRQLTFGDYDDRSPTFSPDGLRIAFSSNRTFEPDSNRNTDIFTVSTDKGVDPAGSLKKITSNPGGDSSPSWSPDGKTIAHITITNTNIVWYATNHLATISANGGEATVLMDGMDRNVSSPVYSPDGKNIYFSLEDSGEQQLAVYNLKNKKKKVLIDGKNTIRAFNMQKPLGKNKKVGAIAVMVSRPSMPSELHLLKGKNLSRLTHINDTVLKGITLAKVENIHYPSKDGTEIEGFLYYPPGYVKGKKYPTILRIHGGPVSQYDHSFNADSQLYAAQGYVVVQTNPRGSSGYGEDFSAAIFAAWGVKDTEDVDASITYLIDQGIADPDKLGVGGW